MVTSRHTLSAATRLVQRWRRGRGGA